MTYLFHSIMDIQIPKFVKWAGGKYHLLEQFAPLFPKQFNRYLEPFVGSGAVFFYVVQTYSPSKSIISDINKELMTAYEIVRDDVE
ncbi:DNA adenine methylase [Candidatus Woesearchaeota archaeon]|nr:MAG: DNA adenine methylase [Candidatus Woesearchaeota archaeon]